MYVLQKAKGLRRRLLFYKTLRSLSRLEDTTKIRLCIITGELEVGGVGRVMLNIIHALPKERYEIFIVTTDPRLNKWAPEFKEHVDHIIDIPQTIGRALPPGYVRQYLRKYLQMNQVDLILITNSTAGYEVLPEIKIAGASQNARVFDLLHTHGTPEDDDAFLKVSIPFDQYIHRRIVISDYLKKYYCQKYSVSNKKVIVIRNGIDELTISHVPDAKVGRNYLRLKSGEQAITYLGRLQEDKSPQRLVDLAVLLKNDLAEHNTIIAVVGEGSMEEMLIKRAKKLGVFDTTIRFYHFTDRPLDICAASSYTIITSDLEGIPMIALESMQVYTPVIAPAVGGLPEIIADGVEGILANIDNLHEQDKLRSLGLAVEKGLVLNKDLHEQMRTAAHAKISKCFQGMGKEYLKLFDASVQK